MFRFAMVECTAEASKKEKTETVYNFIEICSLIKLFVRM